MAEFRPPQRDVAARIYGPAGWSSGTFHIPRGGSFLDFLVQEGQFFKLTEATLPGASEALQFFALRRSAAVIVVPTCDEKELALSRRGGEASPHRISCLLDSGVLTGTIELPQGERVSDLLARHQAFLMMRDCTLRRSVPQPSPPTKLVFLNAGCVVGVSERSFDWGK